jgi:hypothetical protein
MHENNMQTVFLLKKGGWECDLHNLIAKAKLKDVNKSFDDAYQ